MVTLTDIEYARVRAIRGEQQLRDMVVQAIADGLPIAHIAKAAGVTRRTVYAWARESAPTRP